MSRKIVWQEAADWSKEELEENLAYLESRGMLFEAEQARRVASGDLPVEPDEEEEEDRPNVSDKKDDWLDFRAGQGYTEEELEDLTKDELVDLPDK